MEFPEQGACRWRGSGKHQLRQGEGTYARHSGTQGLWALRADAHACAPCGGLGETQYGRSRQGEVARQHEDVARGQRGQPCSDPGNRPGPSGLVIDDLRLKARREPNISASGYHDSSAHLVEDADGSAHEGFAIELHRCFATTHPAPRTSGEHNSIEDRGYFSVHSGNILAGV